MIVDDQPDVRELVELTLRGDNVEILQARSGSEAIALAKAERPRVVIMDVVMPGEIDGLEATRIIKSTPETAHCRVIMLTARRDPLDRQRGLAAGASAYFTKPFSPLALLEQVEAVLGD